MRTENEVVVRLRHSDDIPLLIEVLTEVHKLSSYPVDGPPSFPARFSSRKTLVAWVATCDNTIAGHIELQDHTSFNQLCRESLAATADLSSFAAVATFYVDPKIRGMGIGARLFQEALAWSKEDGKRLALVVLEKDDAAIRMYERMGWVRDVNYFYESIHMIKYKAFLYVAPM